MRDAFRAGIPAALTVCAFAAWAVAQEAGQPRVAGSTVYKTYCAVCHGSSGTGDGPLSASLRIKPPDLTQLARKNEGKFPKELVLRIVDGRNPVKGHGGQDMPVWGDAFKQSREGYSEAVVKEKVEAVVEHVQTLQVP
jgi:mono/diheme cytochrome c family protein